MNKNGPVIIIEDDHDDQEILGEIFGELGYPNKVMYWIECVAPGHYAKIQNELNNFRIC